MIQFVPFKIPTFYNGYIEGNVTSAIGFMSVEKEILRQFLPSELDFGSQNYTEPAYHPIYWCFNFLQKGVSTALPCIDLKYNEFAFVISCLTLRGNNPEEQFVYAPTLLLNDLLAVIGGRLFWQFNKNFAICRVNTEFEKGKISNFDIKSYFKQSTFLQAAFENEGPVINASDSANFSTLLPILKQKFITNGISGYSGSIFDLDFERLMIQPLTGKIQTIDFLPGLSHLDFELESINHNLMGTFQFNTNWKLSKAIFLKS